jgi:hypothetical protein
MKKLTDKKVMAAIRSLTREYGRQCLFQTSIIYSRTEGDRDQLKTILAELVRAGDLFQIDDGYRLN